VVILTTNLNRLGILVFSSFILSYFLVRSIVKLAIVAQLDWGQIVAYICGRQNVQAGCASGGWLLVRYLSGRMFEPATPPAGNFLLRDRKSPKNAPRGRDFDFPPPRNPFLETTKGAAAPIGSPWDEGWTLGLGGGAFQ
jgi:hypothetical protein